MEQQLNIYELAEFYFKDSKEYIVFCVSHDDLLINYIPFKDKEHFEKNFKYVYNNLYKSYFITYSKIFV